MHDFDVKRKIGVLAKAWSKLRFGNFEVGNIEGRLCNFVTTAGDFTNFDIIYFLFILL